MSAWQIVGWVMLGIFFSGVFFLMARDIGMLKAGHAFAFAIACTGFIVVAIRLMITGSLP